MKKFSGRNNFLALGALLIASCGSLGAQSAPSTPDPCILSEAERRAVTEASKFIVDARVVHRTHDINGCSLIELKVSPDGLVKEVKLIRWRGGERLLWTLIAKKLVFAKRPVGWSGVIFIDMRHLILYD